MTKNKFCIIFILFFNLLLFSNEINDYINNIISKENIVMTVKTKFDINSDQEIKAEINYIKNRYVFIKIKQPELFSGVVYAFDLYDKKIYSKVYDILDVSDNVSIVSESIKNLAQATLKSVFSKDKFIISEKDEKDLKVITYKPKDWMSQVMILKRDPIVYKLVLKKIDENNFLFDEILLSTLNEKESLTLKVENYKFIDSETAFNIINDYLSINSDNK